MISNINMTNTILSSVQYVVQNSKNVRINNKNLENFCDKIKSQKFTHWLEKSPCPITLPPKEYLNFLFVLDSISFCYWPTPTWGYTLKNNDYVNGAWALICILLKAIKKGHPINDFQYLNELSYKEFQKIFETKNGIISLPEERYKILKHLSKNMLRLFNGNPLMLLRETKGDANIIIEKVITHFPYFADYSYYHSQKVFFYKKAQLLTADIYYLYKNTPDFAITKNLNNLTACADYKIPYVLRNLNILEYSKNLDEKIKSLIPIISESEEEIEIRANTIWAVELIKRNLIKTNPDIMSFQVNDYLWLMSQQKDIFKIPYHRTVTTKY